MSVINSLLKAFLGGSKSDRDIKEVMPYVMQATEIFATLAHISNDELRLRSQRLREIVQERISTDEEEIAKLKGQMESDEISIEQKESVYNQIDKLTKQVDETIEVVLMEILPEAFAIVKETARRFKENEVVEVTATEFDRNLAAKKEHITINGDKALWANSWLAGGTMITWDMVHYDVQLIGGVVLHKGKIAEMATGEGKTLVATLPVFLNALAGKGVHVVTVNDYLARRDSEWMGPIYEFHGLSVDCIDKHEPHSASRRDAYNCDITFGTNNEFGFDYLRDNMSFNPEDLVQRKHHFAIVDEVDSVLIDDARTPLIISGPVPKGEDQLFNDFKPFVERLYNTQQKFATQLLSDARKLISEGKNEEGGKLLFRAHKGLPKYKPLIKYLSEPGTKQLLLKTENYYMQDNNKQMHIITDDLYFVIDEKNNSVELTDKGIDMISRTVEDKNFFILPDIGSAVADIEKNISQPEEKAKAKDSLLQDYAVKSERVHTVNQLLKAYAMFEKDDEYVVLDNKVKIVDEQTGRILEGRRYSDGLHQAIEAKENVKVEAATQTFATVTLQNYFRMYHKLAGMTGTAETEAGELWSIYKLDVVVIPTNRPISRKDMEDMVYKTKREKYTAVIEEVDNLTKQGRPVLVGTTSVEISELLSRMLKLRGIKHNVLNAKHHQREAEIVSEAGQTSQVTIATNMAGRGTDIKLASDVKGAGGLAIIGTERHESRRVDRQLRGRAGRQGDPGTSLFYVSLEDDLMRLFGSERMSKMMDRLGLKEGEVIQHSWISKSIERAQKKVEENNFGIRKRLLEYDDVMNSQREVIYTRRRHALYGERIEVDIDNMMSDFADTFADQAYDKMDYEEFQLELIRMLSIDTSISENEFKALGQSELSDRLYEDIKQAYERKLSQLAEQAWPVVKDVYEHQAAQYQNIVVPVTDGHKGFNVLANLKRSYDSKGKEIFKSYSKTIMLVTIDEHWMEHLREMDELKQSVQNATYEQKDPLLIYKFESYNLFRSMLEKVNRDVLSSLLRGHIPFRDGDDNARQMQEQREQKAKVDLNKLNTSRRDLGSGPGESKPNEPIKVGKQVGRNDPCPCGSGKKYKACHGKNE